MTTTYEAVKEGIGLDCTIGGCDTCTSWVFVLHRLGREDAVAMTVEELAEAFGGYWSQGVIADVVARLIDLGHIEAETAGRYTLTASERADAERDEAWPESVTLLKRDGTAFTPEDILALAVRGLE